MTRKRWISWLLSAGFGLLILLVLVALAVAAIIRTESGTRFAIQQALAWASVPLTVERTSGSLADGLTLYDLHFENDSVDLRIARLEVVVAMLPLLSAQVEVQRIATDDMHIVVKPGDPSPAPKPLTVPTLRAPVAVAVAEFRARNTTVTTSSDLIIDTIVGALRWNDTRLDIANLDVTTANWSIGARGNATLDENVPLTFDITWDAPPQKLSGNATVAGTLEQLEISHQLEGAFSLNSRGIVEAYGRTIPAANMIHTCADQCGVPDVTVRNLTFSHAGPIDQSVVTLSANVQHAKLPATDLQLRGTATLETLQIESLTARGSALDVTATGMVRWAPAPDVNLKATIAALDTALIHPGVIGNVSGKAALRGGSVDAFTLALDELTGRINGYALNADADLQRRGDRIEIQPLDIRIGDNRLSASGSVRNQQLDLEIDAALPALAQIVPTLAGSITASGQIKGSLDRPQLNVTLKAADLVYEQLSVDTVNGDVRIVAGGAVDGKLSILAINVEERALGDATLSLGGSLQTIDGDIDWTMPGNRFVTSLQVTPVKRGATLRVVSASVDNDALGEWSLDEAFDAGVVDGAVAIAAHRWSHGDSFAQIDEARLDGAAATIRARLSGLPLQTFDPFLPVGLRLAGQVNATVALARLNNVWQGDIDWVQSDTVVRVADGSRSRQLALQTVELRTHLEGDVATCNVNIAGDYELNISGAANLSDLQSAAGPTVDGTLDVTLPDLAWLSPWISGVSELAGSVALNLKAAGTTLAPTLQGRFALENGAVSLEDAGIRLEELQLVGEGRETGALALSGQAKSGGGTLSFDGEVTQAWSSQRALDLSIKGSDVQAFNARDYRVWLSPDLTLKVNAQGARIAGRIDVPRADVRVAEVPPDVVGLSNDIQVTGREPRETFSLPVQGAVTLALGDAVHIYALGLDADLRGDLDLVVAKNKKPRFNGRLYLENGKFEAYGQKLKVDRGNVFYAGVIDNPTLDFRATRSIKSVDQTIVAGVRVTGPAQNPSIEVFAEPAVSQTEALSYLILGRAANEASGADGEALSQAAVAIGMSRSSPLTTQLAAGIGLDELSVAGDSLDAAELVAGKQVNDRLYIRYTYGVFSNLGAILLRYRLSRRLALEAGSDDAQFIDVLYTIEK